MKTRHGLSSFGNVTAILFLLMAGADSRAQDLPVQPSRSATPDGAQTPNLAACSPDGEFYAVATPNGRIRYGRTQDGATMRTFYQCHPCAMLFSPDGRWLAVAAGSNGRPARLKVWQVADGTVLCQMETRVGSDPLLSFSPDGLLLAGSSGDSQVNVWQLPQGTLKCSATTAQPISCIAFSKEGRAVVAICADGSTQRFSRP